MKLCILEPCPNEQETRGLCTKHYAYHRYHKTIDSVALPKIYKHYLSSVNPEEKIAICSTCGPTEIATNGVDKRYGNPQYYCKKKSTAKNLKRRIYTFGDGDTIPFDEAVAARLRLYKEQNGLCAICKRDEDTAGTLCLDHCHTTGEIRGLLCTDCNLGLGRFKDSPENLKAASEYLTR
jgi:hypothetical protein